MTDQVPCGCIPGCTTALSARQRQCHRQLLRETLVHSSDHSDSDSDSRSQNLADGDLDVDTQGQVNFNHYEDPDPDLDGYNWWALTFNELPATTIPMRNPDHAPQHHLDLALWTTRWRRRLNPMRSQIWISCKCFSNASVMNGGSSCITFVSHVNHSIASEVKSMILQVTLN